MLTPKELGLPYADWRPGQRLALRTVLSAKTSHVVINAPTGSGKSTIAAALPRLQPEKRHVLLTATKALQGQYASFPFLVDLKGASNYPCRAASDEFSDWFPVGKRRYVRCDDGPCHLGYPCSLREQGCDYFDAKRRFVASMAGTTNYSAWLANRRVGVGLGIADRLVCDEAHALPEQLMAASGVDIPRYLLDATKAPKGYKGWQRWAIERLDYLSKDDEKASAKREQLTRGLKMMAGMDETWAWDYDERQMSWRFEPTVPRLLMPSLQTFEGGQQCVYLSATITPSMLGLLDIAATDVTFHTMSSSFPIARRPIYFVPGVRADYQSMKRPETQGRFIETQDEIHDDRCDRNGIVHSVSFDRAEMIGQGSRHRGRMLVHRRDGYVFEGRHYRWLNHSSPVEQLIEVFHALPKGAILVSPSVMTGVDFANDAARYQILPKLPFPNTRSNIMRARIRSTPRYRDHFTMQQFVQACGRIVRSEQDWGETFITDAHVQWWYDQNKDLAADWFDDAVVRTRRHITPMSMEG